MLPIISQAITTTVFVVAESRVYAHVLAAALERMGGLTVVGTTFGLAPDDLASIEEAASQVTVLDAAVAGGVLAARRLVAAGATRVAVHNIPPGELNLLAWLGTGSVALVSQNQSFSQLVDAVRRAAGGEATCPPRVTAVALEQLAARGGVPTRTQADPEGALTIREWEVARLIGEGLSNKEIAQDLHIALPTVKNHVHHILGKLRLRGRCDVLRLMLPEPRGETIHPTPSRPRVGLEWGGAASSTGRYGANLCPR